MKKRICLVVNKWWEADPILAVLTNEDARPASLKWPKILDYPRQHAQASSEPRLVFDQMRNIEAELWCISDLLARFPQKSRYQSSSERKMEVLPLIFTDRSYDLVVAAGTASHTPASDNRNGSVYVGTKLYLHDAHPGSSNPDSQWSFDHFDEKLSSTLDREMFDVIAGFGDALDAYLLPEKLNPGSPLSVEANHDYVDINDINVTDYTEYEEKDQEALAAYTERYSDGDNAVLETTLGLVSVAAGLETPFFYVAGIANRVGKFSEDIPHPPYAQNTIASHNAGVVLANVLDRLESFFGS